ncbi:hypothetical protein ADM96_15965 [Burkholderia sp. ST111]|nr:hypothetical protein ADM96_15965 [Burkholderia sp. ST111]
MMRLTGGLHLLPHQQRAIRAFGQTFAHVVDASLEERAIAGHLLAERRHVVVECGLGATRQGSVDPARPIRHHVPFIGCQ